MNMRNALTAILATAVAAVAGLGGAAAASADEHELPRFEAPKDAKLYIIEPKDGAKLKSPVRVVFGLRGMGVAPAGVNLPDTGHHHLVIDAPLPDADMPVPATENYVHFGKGQTETSVELAPGKHTLQLILGDMNHIPHKPPVTSKKITITVKE